MVNEHNEEHDVDLEVTNEENPEIEESELVEEEARSSDKLKQQREKIAALNEEKQALQDELQRTKADFLNAKRRLEEEKVRDRQRTKVQFVEDLLPLCDSFQMAMQDKEAWEKADEAWRKGVEGIHGQLQRILNDYGVRAVDPVGEPFDPQQHEAIGTEVVDDAAKQDTIVSVVQRGYEMQTGGETTTLIRPARVTTGVLEQ